MICTLPAGGRSNEGGATAREGTGPGPAGVGDAQPGGIDTGVVQEATAVGDVDAALLAGRVHAKAHS